MNSLKSLFVIALLLSATFASNAKDKLVKSENINGKITPVVTLNTIDVSASKKDVKLNCSMIADKTFASANANIVRMIYIHKKLVPLVTLKTVEVTATRNKIKSNDLNSDQATSAIENANRIKTTIFNGELMPIVELNTAEVTASRTEQSVMSKLKGKVYGLLSVFYNVIK